MRIERLDLAAFGSFTDHSIDFGAGTPDFHLLYGPNEAGKSTTLAAIADLLYGIEERSAFNFLHAYRDMRLKAVVSEGDMRLVFQRRKGREKTLLDERGTPIDEARLLALRGPEDRTFFTGMFGLDHSRLREGGEHILSAKGDLGQSLFQAGAAVHDLHALLKRLEGEAGALFKPGGQNPRINAALAKTKEAHNHIRQASLKGEAWKQCEEDIARVEDQLKEISERRKGLMTLMSQFERIRHVLPHLAHHDRLVQELAGLADVPLLPEAAAVQRREAEDALAKFGHQAEQAGARLSQLREKVENLSVDGAVLGELAAIGRLREQHGAITKALADLPTRRGEWKQVEDQITAALRNLGRDLPADDARSILPIRPAVAALRALITEEAELATGARLAAQAAYDAVDLATRLNKELGHLPPVAESRPLAECLKEINRHGRPDDLLIEAETALANHQQAIDVALAALPGWSGDAEALARSPVPAPDAVTEADEHLANAARRVEAARKSLGETRDEQARADAELVGLTEAGPVVTEAAVADARHHRDEGWRLVRHRFVEGRVADDTAFATGTPLPDAYERSVAIADSLADRVTGEAQRAAQLAAAIERKALAGQRRVIAEAEKTTALAALAAVEEAWLRLWRESGLEPARPRAMLGFLTNRKEILTRIEQAAGAHQTVTRFQGQIAEGSRKLAGALAAVGEDGAGLDFAALMVRMEATILTLDQRNTQRRNLETHRDRASADAESTKAKSEIANLALDDWRRRWGLAVATLSLAPDVSIAEVQSVLEVAEELTTLVAKRDDLAHRIKAMETDVAGFDDEVAALSAAVAPDLAGKVALDALTDLALRAQTAHDADQALRDLNRQISEAEEEQRTAESQRNAAVTVLAGLCRQAGCERPEDLEEAERRSIRRQAAEAEKSDLERALLNAGDGLGLGELTTEAASVDRDAVASETESIRNQLVVLDDQTGQLRDELARHRVTREAMNGESEAATAAEEVERLSADLRDDAAQYIRLRLGHALLRRAVERFRQRHQGPLMERATALFHRLTLGSFAGLDTGFDDDDVPILLAIRDGGDKLEVEDLSEGTRDQLFLALRLAAVELHLAAGRRLPFIADDLLIHFDDDRAAAALSVLADLATRTQVLFFTHNQHLVELAKVRLATEAYRAMEV